MKRSNLTISLTCVGVVQFDVLIWCFCSERMRPEVLSVAQNTKVLASIVSYLQVLANVGVIII